MLEPLRIFAETTAYIKMVKAPRTMVKAPGMMAKAQRHSL
jgi:hypothetical protein